MAMHQPRYTKRRPSVSAMRASYLIPVIILLALGILAGFGIWFFQTSSPTVDGNWKGESLSNITSYKEVTADQNGAYALTNVSQDELDAMKKAKNPDAWPTVYKEFAQVQQDGSSWSTAFVVWCADLCGYVDSGLVPKTSSAAEFLKYYRSHPDKGTIHSSSVQYEPSEGDIAVLDLNDNGELAIVESFDKANNQIKVIQGDYDNKIVERTLSKSDVNEGFITPSYPEEATAPLDEGELIKIPEGMGDIDVFEAWSLITDKSSPEYKLRAQAGEDYDREGFGKINGRYVVAVRPVYGSVGDYATFTFADGSTIECIIGDVKGEDGEATNKWGHLDGRNILEFLVNKGDWYGYKDNPGTAKNHPEWGQCIVECRNLGNFWGR